MRTNTNMHTRINTQGVAWIGMHLFLCNPYVRGPSQKLVEACTANTWVIISVSFLLNPSLLQCKWNHTADCNFPVKNERSVQCWLWSQSLSWKKKNSSPYSERLSHFLLEGNSCPLEILWGIHFRIIWKFTKFMKISTLPIDSPGVHSAVQVCKFQL